MNGFQEHKKDYQWDEPRYKGYLVYAHDKKSMQRAELIVKNSNPDSIKSFIDQRINNDSVKLAKVVYGVWRKGKKPEVDVITALNTTVSGIYAHLSAVKGGETMKIPSFSL